MATLILLAGHACAGEHPARIDMEKRREGPAPLA
jgi:hypothetical protein